MPPPEYRFEPVTRDDYPLLRRWLAEPHVRAWWGEPEEEIALIDEDLGNGPTDMRIVWQARPFAYVQDYPAHHWPMPHFASFPDGARGIDTFLGETAWLGRGHAAAYLRQRAEALLAAGAPAVVTDPDPANLRGVRAWRAAGFSGDTVAPCEDGSPVLVLSFEGRHLDRRAA
jgi:aminoglycoside 6'-N-acetyltransferase